MVKRVNLEAGNIFRVKLLNGMYVFGHIVFFVPRRNKKRYQEINSESYLRGFLSNCMLVDIYSQISYSEVLERKEVFFKGVFFSSSDLSTMSEDVITVIENEKVDVKGVEFPETIGADQDGLFLQRGELKIKLDDVKKDVQEELLKYPDSFKDVYSVADGVLFFQNRQSEMQRNYYEGWKHTQNDLKNDTELRLKVYAKIGEDPNQSYYELALKHGFDLARLYEK